MTSDAAALLEGARAAASRLETNARRIRQRLARAANEQHVIGWHTVTPAQDPAELADLLHAAATEHGRLLVVVLIDHDPDPGATGAQTKDTTA